MTDRKEKVKNAAIIFLVIMLILTFFSNTIMNYSLAEVSTQRIYSDSITAKVRGSGVVEAGESYTVSIGERRKIATINVKTGEEVVQGDVLITLEDAESEELKTARRSLSDAEDAYEIAVLEAGLTVAERQAIEAGRERSLTEKQNAIAAAEAAVNAAKQQVAAIQAEIDMAGDGTVDTSAEERTVLDAERALTLAADSRTEKERYYNECLAAYEEGFLSGAENLKELAWARDEARREYDVAAEDYNAAKRAFDDAGYNLSVKRLTGTDDSVSIALQRRLAEATGRLNGAEENLLRVNTKMKAEVSIASLYKQISELRETIVRLEDMAVDAEITSPIAGTVIEIAYTAGETVEPETAIVLIQPENKAFTLSFSLTEDQVGRVEVGDPAEVVNNWWGRDVTASVASIRRDPGDRSAHIVTCDISGDVSVGDYYTLSIGGQRANYDLVVPTVCIREDSNGTFILVIESKSTPLGNRYYARRCDVQILAQDDSKSAITGVLEGYENVITTAAKPVAENQQVRLAEG